MNERACIYDGQASLPGHWLVLFFGLVMSSHAANPLTWIWSNPRPHGNNVVDMGGANGTYYQIGDRGQIYTSLDLAFWRPWESTTTNALRALTFFNNRPLISGENGLILYSDANTNLNQINLNTTDWLEGIAASTNLAVAVGDNGAIYSSTSGTNWTRQNVSFTTWLTSVAYGQTNRVNLFAAVGEAGFIATSADGKTWQTRTSGTANNLNKVAWITDRFWAVGDAGIVLTSADGATWTSFSAGVTNNLYTVAGNGTQWLFGGEGVLRLAERRSGSGLNLTWSNEMASTKAAPAPNWTYYAALWDGTAWIVAGRTGMLIQGAKATTTSTDYSWTVTHSSVLDWLWDMTLAGGIYVAVGDRATILTSSAGADWSLESVPNSATNAVLLGVHGNTNGLVAVGSSGTILYSPNTYTNVPATNMVNGQPVVVTNTYSLLGIVWTEILPHPVSSDLQGICYGPDIWVATGGSGTIITSPDGKQWTPRTSPVTAFLTSVAASPQGLVAVGDAGTILTSPDGITWTLQSSGVTNWLYRVRCLENQWIVVGESGILLTSPDGRAWTSRSTGSTRWLNDIAWFYGQYVAVGTGGTILVSSNLAQWEATPGLTGKSLYALAKNKHQLVAAGIEGIILRAQTASVQLFSYAHSGSTNQFLCSGRPGVVFRSERSLDLKSWTTASELELLSQNGLMRFQEISTNAPPGEFFRVTK